jgi:hypothetical protein
MSIYEAMDTGPPAGTAPAPAPQSAPMQGMGGGMGSELMEATKTGGGQGAVAVVKAVVSKQLDLMSLPPVFKVLLGSLFIGLWMPLFFNTDHHTTFFIDWMIWIVLWLIMTAGILEWFGPTLLTGKTPPISCAPDELKPWLSFYAFWVAILCFFGIFGGLFDVSFWRGLLQAFIYALSIVLMTFLSAMISQVPSPLRVTDKERRMGICVWTLLLTIGMLFILLGAMYDSFQPDTFYLVQSSGMPKNIPGKPAPKAIQMRCAGRNDKAEVRCCSDQYIDLYTQENGCAVWAEGVFRQLGTLTDETYAIAYQTCQNDGARLCTKLEAQSGCAANVGDQSDLRLMWTSDSCHGDSFNQEMAAMGARGRHVMPTISRDADPGYMTAANVTCKKLAMPAQAKDQCMTAMMKLKDPGNQPMKLTAPGQTRPGTGGTIHVFPLTMNFTMAECFCHDFGGHLVSLHSDADYLALIKAVEISKVVGPVFLGAYKTHNDQAGQYKWAWSDGSGTIDKKNTGWTKAIYEDNQVDNYVALAYCGKACAIQMESSVTCGTALNEGPFNPNPGSTNNCNG